MNFSDIFKKVVQYFTPGLQEENLTASLDAFKVYLNGAKNKTIRMWVSNAPDVAFRTNTINLLYQLTNSADTNGFEYAGIIEVYYQENAIKTVLMELYSLMPSLNNAANNGKVNKATVNLIEWKPDDKPPSTEVNLGFTGAEQQSTDNGGKESSPALAKRINANYFLRLEPYLSTLPEEIQFSSAVKPNINLAKVDLVGKGALKQRGYWTTVPVPEPDWDYYKKNGYTEQVGIIQSLIAQLDTFDIGITNNISTADGYEMQSPPEDRMFEVVAGYMASQMNGAKPRADAKPIVVLSMDDFSNRTDGSQTTVDELLKGGFTAQESAWNTELNPTNIKNGSTNASDLTESRRNQLIQNLKPASYRKTYLQSVNPQKVGQTEFQQRVNFIWQPTLANVETKYSFLNTAANKVLFVQLGKVPAPMFDYLLSKTTLPAVFGGTGTANLAIQLGKPYFNVCNANSSTVQYPTTLLGYSESDEYEELKDTTVPVVFVPNIVTSMQEIANDINFSLEAWPSVSSKNPAENIGSFIKEYDETSSTEYRTYYETMKDFYGYVSNDKFRSAASYFAFILESVGAIEPVDPDPLGTLLGKIYDNLDKDNNLNLFPGVYGSGAIYKFVAGLISAKITLTNAVVTPAKGTAKPDSITVTGSSSDFLQIPLTFNIVFTAPEGIVVSNWKLVYAGDWLTSEMPWLMFDKPYVLLTVADTTMPTQGGVGGVLRGLDLDLSIRMPIETGVWQLEGHFDTPASISRFYQMAGGVNLVQSLPGPFNAFTAIGVTDCQMAYNQATNNIEYVSFVMATAETAKLTSTIMMDKITFNVLIQNPGSVAKRKTSWSVTGTFVLGAAPNDGTIVLGLNYPGPVFKGQLAKGVITADALFGSFFAEGTQKPEFNTVPVITAFESSFNGTTGDYNVNAKFNTDWTFTILPGMPTLTVTDINAQVQKVKGAFQGGISGGFIFGKALDGTSILSITLSANYTDAKGWVFKGKQTTGTLFDLSTLVNNFLPKDWAITPNKYALKNLGFSIEQKTKYFEISGETADYWDVSFLALRVRADLKFGYGSYKTDIASKDASRTQLLLKNGKTLAVDKPSVGYFCRLNADIEWLGIKMNVFYDFNPAVQKYGFTWGFLTGIITNTPVDGIDHYVGTLTFTDSVTLGSMIEEAISWATGYKYGLSAPFNLLNSISLNALELTYDFTNKQVSFNLNIGPIDLGFCKIDKISLNYKSNQKDPADNGVYVSLEGSFFWITDDDKGQTNKKLLWDAAKPETTPAPSGQGNKYFDLRLLAIGQHVTIPGFANVNSVQEAIAQMAKLPDTDAGEIPGIVFDPNSSWLVGIDFGVLRLGGDDKSSGDKKKALMLAGKDADSEDETGYFIDMQIVFNDPNLYALRIALSGAPARIFKGLDFQILYRKISDSVGVYMAEIALPDVMRKIQLGTVNITLPVFAVEIYTNGDFLVDLGFPKNADFSRSFTLQLVIYVPIPIPIMGSAGLYFGKKSSATSTEVPVISNGTFNPVLVFGVGIQFGLGYDFNAGILAAGFSLTFVTIIEGVLAKFNPYTPDNTSTGQQADIAPAYYYSIKGVVGIQGKLYGYIDFKIIKAEVNIMLSVLADITIAAYKPILLGLTASVSVSVSIKINLGFFKITISFSFKMTIRASYEIKVGGGASPWKVVEGAKSQSRNLLHAGSGIMLSNKMRSMNFLAVAQNNFSATPTWSNLNAAATKAPLKGFIGFGLSMAGDLATKLIDQQAVYTAMLFIESVPASTDQTANENVVSDTSFETLAKQIFRWVIAAFHNGAIDASAVDQIPVSQVVLEAIYTYLNDAANPDAMPVTAIDDFMDQQMSMTVSHPSTNTGSADAAYFPIAPKLNMSLPEVPGVQPALNYSFDGYNALSDSYIDSLRVYFDDLAVQMQQQQDSSNLLKAAAVLNAPESLATFIYTDYFLLIARQMIHNAQNALSSFQYNMAANQTPDDVIDWINNNGQFDGGYAYTPEDLFDDNKTHLLNKDKPLTVSLASCNTISEDTFTNISTKSIYSNGFTAADLATLNAANSIILQSGLAITYPGKDDIITQAGYTIDALAVIYKVTTADFISKSNVLTLAGLLLPSSTLLLPDFAAQTQDGDTLVSFAARYGIGIQALAKVGVNTAVVDLFDINDNKGKLIINELPQFLVGEIIKEIQADDGLNQLSGMASRYYLTGLRLPTAGITPNYQGMWVNKDMTYAEDTAGLFSLTGQQFPLPVLQADTSFDIKFTIPSSVLWMQFDNNTQSLDISITAASDDYGQINTVRIYAQSNYLDLDIQSLGLGDMFNSSFVHYSFSTVSTWQAGSNISLPYSGITSESQSLSIWSLPSDLINLADPTGRAVTPRFQVQVGTVDPATKAIKSNPVGNYGWGTQVDFTIKKVPLSADSPASAQTYEISGADGNNALLLEKMVTYLGTDNSLIDLIALGFTPNQSNGSNPGVQTDPIANLTIGIAQANLSTFTRPAPHASLLAKNALVAQQEQSNLLNTPAELIRLLWQASITRDGGYYLYYFNSENGEGLPDHAFNDKGEAILSLLTVYTAPAETDNQDLLQPYMNMFVTGTAVDVNSSSIYAQAAPITQKATFNDGDVLTDIAYQYFTNVGDVVIDNPTAALTAGIGIYVPEGTYMVTAAGGELFQSVADKFGTSTIAIQNANPLISSWPPTLPQYTALRLPILTVNAEAGDHTKTLPAIALYYGMDITALANYNSNLKNLFVAGTVLNMAGGPITRVATVPAGVLSLEAIRNEPADVPAKYSDANYALLFLQQNFSILTFKLAANPWFKGSVPSLPVGPTDSDASASNQRNSNLDTTGKWIFKQSVPYSKFAIEPQMSLAAGLPDVSSSPYKGIGYLVQLDFLWLDIYGNKILNTLSQSTGGVINEAPILTGYTDALLGVSQWPSVASSWQVSDDKATSIQIPLSFDTTQYNGLLSASASTENNTEILLIFTEALDPVTAMLLVNYKLSPDVSITGAALQAGDTIVELTVGALEAEMVYTLSIGNIQNVAKTVTFDGQATFSLTNGGADLEASSSVIQQAAYDFQVYTQLWYQLTDPNGMEMSMLTTLFEDKFVVAADVYNDLVHNWIASIYLYLQDRSNGGTTVAAPAAIYTLSFNIDPTKVNDEQIFEITLSCSIERIGGAVMGDFETTGSVKKVTTLMSPSTNSKAGTTRGLDDFANSFESAMSIPDQYYLKISTGADRDKLGQQKPDGTIWAVRLGIKDNQAIAYDVVAPGSPTLFAPRPISNKLESRTGVPIYGYKTGVGINFNTPDYQKDFTEIDLDQWVGSFFSSMDEILTPEFTASIQLVDKKMGSAHLQSIQSNKEALADIAKVLMTTVFEGEAGDAAAVQEALKQALLVKLMNLYATNSGIQFDVNVKADEVTGTPPNLYGNFMQNTILEGAVASPDKLKEVTLYFSSALDATSAGLISNYTLTSPLTVTNATLSADGQSVVLTSSADVIIGTTMATISDALLDTNNRTVEGLDSFVIATSYVSYAKTDQLTITAAKIKLDSSATQPLAFLLSAPEIVRGQDGEVLSMINLNLSYKGTDIEHQIGTPVNGFTPSSWLSFVLPTVRVPLESQLGGFSVPMFLRSFPQNPSLVNQNGLAPNVDASDISTLLEWIYIYDYTQSYHYPQDTLYFTVDFNVGDTRNFRLAAFPDAFNQLAEFVSVYPSIEIDLKTLLTQIDANVYYDTGSDATTLFNDSNIALQSFITIVGNIVAAAAGGGGLRMQSQPKPYGSTNVAPYSFEIQEGAKSLDGQQIQVVTVKGKPPVGVNIAEVYIQPETYQMLKWASDEDPCLGDVCYYYINRETGKPLLSETAQNIQQREIQIPGLNILQRQDAATSVFLTRNENLIPGKITNTDFVYTTGELSFSNPYLPSITSYQVIEVANLPDNTGQPTQRLLLAQFEVLMETLLKENEEPVLSFQMTCIYDYLINPVLSPISLPVFMQTMMAVTLATDLEPMLQSWTDAINTWFANNDPNTNGGCYKFDLIIFSNLTKQPFPLVRLTNLQLSLVNILPS